MAMKNTPHDYYPTFPDNPRIGRADGHPQWIEFDCWGQYFGMGFFPVSVIEDMQRRLRHCRASGATGVWFRTDLEVINDQSVFSSFDVLNLMGGAMLSRQIEQDLDRVYRAWLAFGIPDVMKSESEQGPPVPVGAEHLASWSIMEGTIYIRGFVFTEGSCQFPVSVDRAFSNMLVFQGREDWEPGANRRVEPTEENIRVIFAEKTQAIEEVKRLPEILKIDQTALPAPLKESVRTMLDLYALYVRGYCLCTFGCYLTRKAERSRTAADMTAAKAACDAIVAYRAELARKFADTAYNEHGTWFFEVSHLDRLIEDIRGKLAALSPR